MLLNMIRTLAALFVSCLCLATHAFGQSDSLVLASGSTTRGGVASLNLSISAPAGSAPASIQWTLAYAVSDILSISAASGPAATAAGKLVDCRNSPGSYICVLTGVNSSVIQEGVVAVVTVTLSPTVTNSTSIAVTKTLGASLAGSAIVTTGIGGAVVVASGAPASVNSLSCSPTFVSALESSTCTVTLNQAAASNTYVALTDNSSGLTVPASVIVSAGAASAIFSVGAGAVSASQNAVVTATLGTSSGAASLILQPLLALSSLQCSPSTLTTGAVSLCTVTMNRAADQNITIPVSTNNSLVLQVPPSTVLQRGSSSATFSVTAQKATSQAIVIVTLAKVSKWAAIIVSAAQESSTATASVSSLICSPATLIGAASSDCTIGLTHPAQTGGVSVALSADAALQLTSEVLVPQGSTSAHFSVRGRTSDSDQQAKLVATTMEGVAAASLSIVGIKPVSLSCTPEAVQAGNTMTCNVHLNSAQVPDVLSLTVASSSADIEVPAAVATRPMQSDLSFQSYVSPGSKQQSVSLQVSFGGNAAQTSVITLPAQSPVLTVPGKQSAKVGAIVSFTISALDGDGGAVALTASKLPPGASFDPASGSFSWTPVQAQEGNFDVVFMAVNALHHSSTADVLIAVGSGKPMAKSLVNGASQSEKFACSPGEIASLLGSWLVQDNSTWFSPTASVTQLGGTQVTVNGEYVPVLYASGTRVDFLCPQLSPETPILVSLETSSGRSEPVTATMKEATPGIFTQDGSGQGQGIILFSDSSAVAIARNPLTAGEPAQAGDQLAIRTTGLSPVDLVLIKVGNVAIPAQSIRAVADRPGISEILVSLPAGVPAGNAVPVYLEVTQPDGEVTGSNVVTMAIEPVLP